MTCGSFSEIDLYFYISYWDNILLSNLFYFYYFFSIVIQPWTCHGGISSVSSLATFYLGMGVTTVCLSIGSCTLWIFPPFILFFARSARLDWCFYPIMCKGEYWCGIWRVLNRFSSVWRVELTALILVNSKF